MSLLNVAIFSSAKAMALLIWNSLLDFKTGLLFNEVAVELPFKEPFGGILLPEIIKLLLIQNSFFYDKHTFIKYLNLYIQQ